MSRSLVLGNGNILLLFDKYAQLRDFYFPYAGQENHIGFGNVHKIGVWVDGTCSWFSDDGWQIGIDYEKDTMVSRIVARNDALSVEVSFSDIVYNEKNIFLRTFVVNNLASKERVIKIFFNQQFQISETSHADTAYYHPEVRALIHYKGRRVFLVGAQTEGKRFDDYSVGIFKIEGKEGTWRDAEDGELSENPIEHGSVDSTLGLSFNIKPLGKAEAEYWIAVAETFKEVNILQDYLLSKTPAHVVKTTQDFWKAWVKKFNFSFYKLDDSIVDLFQKSLFIMRTHCDDRGGILASGDSDNFRYGRDTYAYVWPRDGAFVALSLDKAGYFDVSRKFYEFCNDVITEDGFLLHKYQPDKSFGSSWHPWVKNGKSQLAIQEDETALLIFGLWEHYKKSRDLEFVEKIYNSFIKSGTDFMMRYLDGLKTHLPFPSYDLWEEKNGVSTFTASSVYGALKAAVEFADVLGKEEDAMRYDAAAEEMKKAIIKELYNEKTEYFEKIITINGDDVKKDSTVDVSGFLGAFRFGVMLPDDPRMLKAREVIRKWLETPIPVGGIARYEGDVYYGVSSDVPGNPWFITTLWMIQYDIALAKKEEDFVAIKEKLKWVTDKAQKSGILSEQIHPYTGEQLSVSPLTWSHAEFVLTIIAYLERLEVLGICTVCYPVK